MPDYCAVCGSLLGASCVQVTQEIVDLDFILIFNKNESAYMLEVGHPPEWCRDNELVVNTSKTKEMIIDFRRSRVIPWASG